MELKRVKTKNDEVKEKVGELEGVTASCKHRTAYLENLATSTLGTNCMNDQQIVNTFQVSISVNTAMIQ